MHNIDKKTCRWADSCTTIGLLLTLLFGASSCDSDEIFTQHNGSETTSLTISIGTPTVDIATRGVSDDPDNANDTWTDWELLVDGSRLYRATLMLVDNTNKLVGYADFNNEIKTTRPTEVTATFNELTPNATYKLYAIANYSAIDSWAGLTGMPNLASLTVGSDITSTITALNNYVLPNTGTDYIAAKQPQPLSLVQEITMPAYGSKSVSAELLRTYARLRIEIENRSETDDLKVNSFTFGSSTSNFGYRTTPLMKVEDSQIPNANGRLDYDATDAITPFVYNESNPLTIAKLNNSGTSNNSAVAFDAYIYENKNTNGFEYNLSLEYGNSQIVEETTYHKGQQRNTPTGGDDNLYMIAYRVRTGGSDRNPTYTYYYLTANQNGIGTTTNTNTVFDNQAQTVFWEIEHVNGNTYTIRSVSQNSYLDITTSDAGLNENTANLTINSQNIYKPIYIKRNDDNDINVSTEDALKFSFFPISKKGNKWKKGNGAISPTGSNANIYMIGYYRNGTYRYLTANKNGVGVTTNNNTEFNNQAQTVFWEIEHVNGNTYTIRSVSQESYLDITTSDAELKKRAANLTINSQNIYKSIYIKRNEDDDNDINVGTENALDFYFFPISKETEKEIISEGIERDFDIPLSTIIDGVSKPTNIIRRNDFINVLVTVSYNENSGSINFHVSDWNTGKGGDVTFD